MQSIQSLAPLKRTQQQTKQVTKARSKQEADEIRETHARAPKRKKRRGAEGGEREFGCDWGGKFMNTPHINCRGSLRNWKGAGVKTA